MIDFELRALRRKYVGKMIRQTVNCWGKRVDRICLIDSVWRDSPDEPGKKGQLMYGVNLDNSAGYWLHAHNSIGADEFEVIE